METDKVGNYPSAGVWGCKLGEAASVIFQALIVQSREIVVDMACLF